MNCPQFGEFFDLAPPPFFADIMYGSPNHYILGMSVLSRNKSTRSFPLQQVDQLNFTPEIEVFYRDRRPDVVQEMEGK